MKNVIISECNVIKGNTRKCEYPLMLTNKDDKVIVFIGLDSNKISNMQKKLILNKLKTALEEMIVEFKSQSM